MVTAYVLDMALSLAENCASDRVWINYKETDAFKLVNYLPASRDTSVSLTSLLR